MNQFSRNKVGIDVKKTEKRGLEALWVNIIVISLLTVWFSLSLYYDCLFLMEVLSSSLIILITIFMRGLDEIQDQSNRNT
ncbi:hypothetical protein [Flexithrix dorotheae]|uniref:hypothetical protein n=1 Tax=Flexithrix dorotheae TaxID=70993 RepID=UPI00035F1DEE|nr:hypothetical protein [Flexithrix dorotheae]